MDPLRLPSPCLLVLVGPGASGKSTWAAAHFPADQVVSSDRLRALVGAGEDDLAASGPAFELLDLVVRHRLARRLTTVIDTLGLDDGRRRSWLALARHHRLPCVAVAFDTPPEECRARNQRRAHRIPLAAISAQLRAWPRVRACLPAEGFDAVLAPQPVRVVPEAFVGAAEGILRQREQPRGLRFGLHLSSFGFRGGAGEMAGRLREIAGAAESAGFDAIYVMDHFRQIPQIGRAWEDFLESYTTLAYLAACTERARIGALVTGITLRLAARYADAANVLGDTATVRRKAAVLREHCREAGRDPGEVALSHLSTALVGTDDRHLAELVERLRPRRQDPGRYAAAVHAGTVEDHVGRFRELAQAGAAEVVVRLPDLADAEPLERMRAVIGAFR